MTLLTRSFINLRQQICIPATRKVPVNDRRCISSIVGSVGRLTVKSDSTKNFSKCCTSRIPSTVTVNNFRQLHSDGGKDLVNIIQSGGDQELVRYLNKEIKYEEGTVCAPALKNFHVSSMDGTRIKLRSNLEDVKVVFNINDMIFFDDDRWNMMGEDIDTYSGEDENAVITYPTFLPFTVKITKSSGMMLLLNCDCISTTTVEGGMNEDDDEDDEDDDFSEDYEEAELLRIQSVQMFDSENVNDPSKIYKVKKGIMDGELNSMLMNILLEHGINRKFVKKMFDLGTFVEHQHYLDFLKSLKSFGNHVS